MNLKYFVLVSILILTNCSSDKTANDDVNDAHNLKTEVKKTKESEILTRGTSLENSKLLKDKEKSELRIDLSDAEKIGKWAVTNKYVELFYSFELFKKKDYYYVKILDAKDSRIKNVHKNGSKYYVDGDKSGEYYQIKGKQMILYDSDGSLESAGYKAIFIE